jgi:large subunit ribosomal protein L18
MSVHRSHANIGCQLIDDANHRTIVSVSTRDREFRETIKYGGNADAAQAVGKLVAQRALEAGIQRVRFDRGECKYHGRVAALADAAREAGLSL